MAITTFDGLIAALCATNSQRRSFIYPSTLGNSTAMWYDQWFATGLWGAASTPATAPGELLTSASPGALPLTAPSGSNTLYLAALDMGATVTGQIIIYDRLWQCGGLAQGVTTLQTINGATMTRPDDHGYDAEVWAIAEAAGGSYGPTLTLKYYNAAGDENTGTTVMPSNIFHNQYAAFPLNLAAGDNSVASVVSIQQSTDSTAVNFALAIIRRIATIDIRTAHYQAQKDALQLALATIDSGACISMMFGNASASGGAFIDGHLTIVQG